MALLRTLDEIDSRFEQAFGKIGEFLDVAEAEQAPTADLVDLEAERQRPTS